MKNRFTIRLVSFGLLAMILIAGCATFEGELPVELDIPDTTYISPANQDGIQDELTITVELTLPIPNVVVERFRITIADAERAAVIVLEETMDKATLRKLPRAERKKVKFSEYVVWDGTDDLGEYVPDGEYIYWIETWDKQDNKGQSPFYYVVVDNTSPDIELSLPYPVFSPNGDGRLDLLTINQRNSSSEEQWSGEIRDAEQAKIKSFSWEGRAGDFAWDGTDDSGGDVPDGMYFYALSSTDLAGNSSSFQLTDIYLDTEVKPLAVNLEYTAFSPNGDGKKDALALLPVAQRSSDVVRWQLTIFDQSGAGKRTLKGTAPVPGSLVFEGQDDGGRLLADGPYRAELAVEYKNGDEPRAASPVFLLDTTPPRAVLNAEYTLFSPDGDSRRDVLVLNQSTSEEDAWNGVFVDASGRVVSSFSWKGKAFGFSWDGKDGTGEISPDGEYVYRITSTDRAENSAVFELRGIMIDTRATPVAITAVETAFSPNKDGVLDVVTLNVGANIATGIKSWQVSIRTEMGDTVKAFSGIRSLPGKVVWDGTNDRGALAAEGSYIGVLGVEYEKGNLSEAQSKGRFLLDVSPPKIVLNVSPLPFSPDGDGTDDVLSISAVFEDKSPLESWTALIADPVGNPFIEFAGQGDPKAAITWNGKSRKGELPQSAADYTLTYTARDTLWNTGSVSKTIPVDILVMKYGDQLKIIISSIFFERYTASYTNVEPDQAARNLVTLDRLAEILKKYSDYRIKIEGHAVRELWNKGKTVWLEEENDILLPLSKERADVIKAALVEHGIVEDRVSTEGLGGYKPVVPHGDLANRWKNRRVEFILIKK